MNKKNNFSYFLNLSWTYTIETEYNDDSLYYIIRVNELPGICTDAENLHDGMKEIQKLISCAIDIYIEKIKFHKN